MLTWQPWVLEFTYSLFVCDGRCVRSLANQSVCWHWLYDWKIVGYRRCVAISQSESLFTLSVMTEWHVVILRRSVVLANQDYCFDFVNGMLAVVSWRELSVLREVYWYCRLIIWFFVYFDAKSVACFCGGHVVSFRISTKLILWSV